MTTSRHKAWNHPDPLTHTGRPIVAGFKALVASLPGSALIAAVGVGADRTVRGANRGELGTLILICGRGREEESGEGQGGGDKRCFSNWDLTVDRVIDIRDNSPVQRPFSFSANP